MPVRQRAQLAIRWCINTFDGPSPLPAGGEGATDAAWPELALNSERLGMERAGLSEAFPGLARPTRGDEEGGAPSEATSPVITVG